MPHPQLVEPFLVTSERIGADHHVCPAGELDIATAPILERDLLRIERGDAERIIVDLRALTFMDTAGLHLLERAHQRSLCSGNRLCLIAGSHAVHRALSLTDVERSLPFIATGPGGRPDAIAA